LEHCGAINPAMTVKHFASLICKMSDNPVVIERRLGGLRNLGVMPEL
jgi:hypothetical protein